MEKNKPLVSIIIPHWNGEKIIYNCLKSLFQSTYENYEVIVVDNHSTDKSVIIIEANFPKVRLIKNSINTGFAKANNQAAEIAKGEYICLLNNDTEVEPDWLEKLVTYMETHPKYDIVQPKIRSLRNKAMFEFAGGAGGFIDKYGYPFTRGRIFYTIEKDDQQYDDETQIFWASGCSFIMRKLVINQIGFLDEDFFAHQEEIDFCWRANIAGHKIGYCSEAVMYHLGGTTLKEDSFLKIYLNHRNNMQMVLKNMSTKWLLKSMIPRIFLEITSGFLSIKRFAAVWKALFYNLLHINRTLKKRKEIQKLRNIDDDEIMSLVYKKSIVLSYFMWHKKKFTDLKWK